MSTDAAFGAAVARYGQQVRNKLSAVAIAGAPEDQLRAPLESLFSDLAVCCSLDPSKLVLIGETHLGDLKTRPDYAVSYNNALIGFIEVKAPGKGADPRKFRDPHDKAQWSKLKALPNLLYTDGESFCLTRSGEVLKPIGTVSGDIAEAGAALTAPTALMGVVGDFLTWKPAAPRTPRQLAEVTARLCRLMRDEVVEQMERQNELLEGLATDWRNLLFPNATDAEFADGYAQTVTFGLLLARARGISLAKGVDEAARKLGSTHSLIGTALRALTDETLVKTILATSVGTLTRVLEVVDWATVAKKNPELWMYFYEDFLEHYDKKAKQRTGSYYTPVEVADAMVALVDEALFSKFDRVNGLASDSVTVLDPAVGTGTFLRSVIRRAAMHIEDWQGAGAVGPAMSDLLKRIIGFELQLGPFAVAQLQIAAELTELGASAPGTAGLRMYVTNTLDNPYQKVAHLGSIYEPISASHRAANAVKSDAPVFVVLGNPPYKEKAKGRGSWVEQGVPSQERALLADFFPPREWGVSTHSKHLYNMYVYFWRWALWKVFEQQESDDNGIICFITVAGFLDGDGFQKMRAWMRDWCDEIFVIHCSPEGHQPPAATRVFAGVQHEVCIVIAVRNGVKTSQPADTYYRSLQPGPRKDKFAELASIRLADCGWVQCSSDKRAPFFPQAEGLWAKFPTLDELFCYSGSGIMPGRTWIISPDIETLQERWKTLVHAEGDEQREMFSEHKRDRRTDTKLSDGLPGYPRKTVSVSEETETSLPEQPVQIAYRSFDRQWIIPDKRLINQINPSLWWVQGAEQIYLTAPTDIAVTSGPAATFSAIPPDLHHYNGRGGRAYPLWLDPYGHKHNFAPGLIPLLETTYSYDVKPSDVMAYVAAVTAHPGFTETFINDLKQPGVRVPITADAELFERAVQLGRRVLWLHTYGTRYVDPGANRAAGSPRMMPGLAPRVTTAIPDSADRFPNELTYHPDIFELHVGEGVVQNVNPRMRGYEVSGLNVLDKWFSYRKQIRERPVIGDRKISPLQEKQPETWLPRYTEDLIALLNVLGLIVELESSQKDLLATILERAMVTLQDLKDTGVLPISADARKKPTPPKSSVTSDGGIQGELVSGFEHS